MRLTRALAVLAIASAAMAAVARPRAVRPGGEATRVWLRQHATMLSSVEPVANDVDLSVLAPLVSGARVIALGDATHGTHELFALKQRLIPWLIRHADVRTVALEAPYGNFEAIRDYVLTGKGDPAALIQSTDYFFWDSEEVLAVIRFVRGWNAAGNPPVEFVGVDPFHADASAARVLSFLRPVDADAAAAAAEKYRCVTAYGANPNGYAVAAAAYRNACHQAVMSVGPAIAANRAQYEAMTTPAEVESALHAARNVELGEEVLAAGIADRDRGMAENIEYLAEQRGGGNVVVWGHNEHFGKEAYTFYTAEGTKSAGAMLRERYGEAYVAIGSVVLNGSFNAIQYDGGVGTIGPVPIDTATPDDWATIFATAGSSPLLIPMRGSVPSSLAGAHTMRVAGSVVGSITQTMKQLSENLASRFDAVIYVETSTPTRLRHTKVVGVPGGY